MPVRGPRIARGSDKSDCWIGFIIDYEDDLVFGEILFEKGTQVIVHSVVDAAAWGDDGGERGVFGARAI